MPAYYGQGVPPGGVYAAPPPPGAMLHPEMNVYQAGYAPHGVPHGAPIPVAMPVYGVGMPGATDGYYAPGPGGPPPAMETQRLITTDPAPVRFREFEPQGARAPRPARRGSARASGR